MSIPFVYSLLKLHNLDIIEQLTRFLFRDGEAEH